MFARLRPSAVFRALVDVVAAPAVMQCLFHPNKIKLHSVSHVLLLEKILLQRRGEKTYLKRRTEFYQKCPVIVY